jgi:hypothetical protein
MMYYKLTSSQRCINDNGVDASSHSKAAYPERDILFSDLLSDTYCILSDSLTESEYISIQLACPTSLDPKPHFRTGFNPLVHFRSDKMGKLQCLE